MKFELHDVGMVDVKRQTELGKVLLAAAKEFYVDKIPATHDGQRIAHSHELANAALTLFVTAVVGTIPRPQLRSQIRHVMRSIEAQIIDIEAIVEEMDGTNFHPNEKGGMQ